MKISRRNLIKIIQEEIRRAENSLPGVKIHIDPDLDRCQENRDLILDFCKFCGKELDINHDINVRIVSNREKENITTTAFYNPEDHDIAIYGKKRAIVDICRSIAHELTHMSQMLQDRIKFPVQDAGGEIEDEANARAGEIIKLFAKSNNFRKSIYESRDHSRGEFLQHCRDHHQD